MEGINQQIQEVLKANESAMKQNPTTSRFEEALKEFNRLVKDGIIKPRGYNLFSIDNINHNEGSFKANL